MSTMPIFWLSAFALALAVLVALVWPLMRRQRKSEAPEDEAVATAIFRDHKRQLDADFAAGTLSAADRDAAQAELVSRLGGELALEPAAPSTSSDRSRWIAALVLVAVVPVLAGVLYVLLGNPAAVNAPAAPAMSDASPHGSGDATDPQVVAMIDRLAEKMKANPDDPKGWVLLGRSYLKMGRYDDALAAFAEASKRMPEDAGLLADQAEAIAMKQGRKLAGRPAELLKRALADRSRRSEGDRHVRRGRGRARRRGHRDQALSASPDDGSAEQRGFAADRPGDRGAPGFAQRRASAVAAAPPAAAPAAAPATAKAAPPASATASAGAAGAGVSGSVEIDPKLAAKMAPGDTLFIYARNAEGSRMPLAIMRGTAGDLPKTFALTDAMAMTPAQTISLAKSVVVEARISKANSAMPQPGDLRGASAPIAPGAANVRIVIDQVVP